MLKSKKLFAINCLVLLFTLITCNPAYADGAVFQGLSDYATNFAVGFKYFAYVLSGFGIIMFTFLAIFGKINFKHLGYIVLCLFFLSGVGALIDYILDADGKYVIGNQTYKFNDTYTRAVCKSSVCR